MHVQGGLKFNPTSVTALSLSSTFFNYAPCLIQEAAAGAAFTAAGINFVPQVSLKHCILLYPNRVFFCPKGLLMMAELSQSAMKSASHVRHRTLMSPTSDV